MTPIPLARATLGQAAARARVPLYDPAGLAPGIVHLGPGAFHRAHMARYTHDLMDLDPAARAWGILGAGLLPADEALRAALAPQDGLYALMERDRAVERVTIIGALCGLHCVATQGAAPLLAAMDDPAVMIVSLTVSEAGYGLSPAARRLDPARPEIARDLASPRSPGSVIGLIVEAYRRRRAAGLRPFTALSCDNIERNGDVLKAAVLAFADRLDPDLAAWIAREARFPATMVDRITPRATPGEGAHLAARHGLIDAAPVVCEGFRQWVIEDDFVDGRRPAWDRVGAQFVADVSPYEFMKLRLLNASHLAVAGLAALMGYRFIHQAMGDPRLAAYMRALMDLETTPTLAPVPGVDLAAYKAKLVERFSNPAILDTAARVNADAPLNLLLDPIRDRRARGEAARLLALGLAAWMRRLTGRDDAGAVLEARNPQAARLRRLARAGGADPRPLLGLTALFGDLAADHAFVAELSGQLGALYGVGAAGALERALASLAPAGSGKAI